MDVENGFAPNYVVIADRKKIITELKKLAKDADESTWRPTRTARARPSPGTWRRCSSSRRKGAPRHLQRDHQNAIREAFEHPRVNENKVDAQQARRILDRLVGYQLSPLLWDKVRRGLSAGRVQSVAVRLIVDREREIEAFERWSIGRSRPPSAPRTPRRPSRRSWPSSTRRPRRSATSRTPKGWSNA